MRSPVTRHRVVAAVVTALVTTSLLLLALAALEIFSSLMALGPEDAVPVTWCLVPLLCGLAGLGLASVVRRQRMEGHSG